VLVRRICVEADRSSREVADRTARGRHGFRYQLVDGLDVPDTRLSNIPRANGARFVARTCPYVRGNPAAYCGQRLRAARQGRSSHQVQMESRAWASATGGGISGLGATSPPPAATSRTMSYFSIFRSTNLPVPAGSYSVYGVSGSPRASTMRSSSGRSSSLACSSAVMSRG
jgi:hypothetical protein